MTTYSFKLNKEWSTSLEAYFDKAGVQYKSEGIRDIITKFLMSEAAVTDVLTKDLSPLDKLKANQYPIDEYHMCPVANHYKKLKELECLGVKDYKCHAHSNCQTSLLQRLGI